MSASGNGTSDGIVWATSVNKSAITTAERGTLRAFDPITLVELYNSDSRWRDKLGALSKFAAPTIANGRVYVATGSGSIAVYGLLYGS